MSTRSRVEALYARDGARCQLCGGDLMSVEQYREVQARISEQERLRLAGRPSVRVRLGKRFPTVDHIKERRNGGTNHLSNLRLAHAKCNSERCNGRPGLRHRIGWAWPDEDAT